MQHLCNWRLLCLLCSLFCSEDLWHTNQSNSGVTDASVVSSLCLSAARYVGLGSRAERQSEGESDRERHAGSDGQSGDFTGRWRLCEPHSQHYTVCSHILNIRILLPPRETFTDLVQTQKYIMWMKNQNKLYELEDDALFRFRHKNLVLDVEHHVLC